MLSALFAPISTRNRRQAANGVEIGQENHTERHSIEMRGFDSPIGTESSTSSEEVLPPNSPIKHSASPAPSIRVEDETSQTIFETPKIRSRMILGGTPQYYLNGGRTSPLEKTVYYKKLLEKGCSQHDEDVLAPAVRRKAEASLSRTPSIASLYGSMRDLRGSNLNLSQNGKHEDDPNLGRFKSMSPAYRSFNSKRTLDRQNEVLEKLAKLRDQLRSKENFMERGHMGQLKQTSRPTSTNNLTNGHRK
ncbi:hypothetical protein WR25_06434 [Diploscapter pachys]|uniref:Uncharacterized protein n=1 Tax=Diploscapter pachys TaxID=2018661 RepID=A0A2A2K8Z0_9BILA|nr:hypothetical protein WR25_06434 [Diploscapter pachys]